MTKKSAVCLSTKRDVVDRIRVRIKSSAQRPNAFWIHLPITGTSRAVILHVVLHVKLREVLPRYPTCV